MQPSFVGCCSIFQNADCYLRLDTHPLGMWIGGQQFVRCECNVYGLVNLLVVESSAKQLPDLLTSRRTNSPQKRHGCDHTGEGQDVMGPRLLNHALQQTLPLDGYRILCQNK